METQNLTVHSILRAGELNRIYQIFQMHLNILSKLWLICCWHQQKIQKWATFDIFITITREVNMITRQMTPFFLSTLWALSVCVFHFCISRSSKFSSMGSLPLLYYVLVCKITHLHAKDDTFKPVNIYIFFLKKIL